MGGGLMQLVAYGAQDIYLTGNPQITFFKAIYRRHTNFSIESISQTFDGKVDFGEKVTCTIARNGDLVGRMYLEVLLNSFEIQAIDCDTDKKQYGGISSGSVARTAFMHKLGNGMIKYIECEIGGQLIDRQYGEWMEIWVQLSKKGYGSEHYNYLVTTDAFCVDDQTGRSLKLYIPLQFWFNDNPGLALPLIALQYHDVKINLHIEELKNVVRFDTQAGIPNDTTSTPVSVSKAQFNAWHTFIYQNSPNLTAVEDNDARTYLKNHWQDLGIKSCQLYCDYIYLDTDERRRFAQVSHEYLIHQIGFTGASSVSRNILDVNIDLELNHPVKELIWIVENDPHLNYEQINKDYRGLISTCSVDPSDRFTWLNNANTCSIEGEPLSFDYSTTYGNVRQIGGVNTYKGIEGTNIFLPNDTATVSLLSRPRSALRFWDQVDSGVLQLNGHDRFSRRDGRYFKWVQTYQHHSGFEPGVNNIYCYSFAIKPEEHQPSGTCNFSRIDGANLNLSLFKSIIGPKNYIANSTTDGWHAKDPVDRKIRVYATNYNVLRVMSGMGGLAYSN